MSRLIDADKLIKELHEALDGSGYDEDYKDMGIDDFIMSQPTAYDVEKVVEELEEAKEKIATEDYCRTKHYVKNDCEHKDCFKCCAEYLIDIVRKGGVE